MLKLGNSLDVRRKMVSKSVRYIYLFENFLGIMNLMKLAFNQITNNLLKSTRSLFLFLLVSFSTARIAAQTNLISNSGFESGFIGFTNDSYAPMTQPSLAGQIVVDTNPSIYNTAWTACKDKSGSGKMLIVDAATNKASKFLIINDINVIKGNTYLFSFWVQSVSTTNNSFEKPKLQVLIGDGNSINDIVYNTDTSAFPQQLCEWKQMSFKWKATGNKAYIQISNTTESIDGNDFAIDDLNFVQLPLAFTYSYKLNSGITKKDAFVSLYATGGTPPYVYRINGGAYQESAYFANLEPGKTYVIAVKDNGGNEVVDSFKTLELLNASFFKDESISRDTILAGATISLYVNGATNFIWRSIPRDNTLIATLANQEVKPKVNTQYTISTTTKQPSNLLNNADFENGNIGFGSDYFHFDANTSNAQQVYGLVASADAFESVFSKDIKPISGSRMMAVDGAATSGFAFWRQTVPVLKDSVYEFNYSHLSMADISPAQFSVRINGTVISTKTLSSTAGQWNNENISWTADTDIATIELVNTNNAKIGNDFAIDNLSFKIADSKDTLTITQSVVLNVSVKPSVVASNPVCAEAKGSLQFVTPVAKGYQYEVVYPDNSVKIFDTSFISGLGNGLYSVKVKDALGRDLTLDTTIVIEFNAAQNRPIVEVVQPGCEIRTGTVYIKAPKNPNISYLLLNNCVARPIQTSDTFAGLKPCDSTYRFYAIDASVKDCRSSFTSVKVADPPFRPRSTGASSPSPNCTDNVASILFSGLNSDYSISIDSGATYFKYTDKSFFKGFETVVNDSIRPSTKYPVFVKYEPTGCTLSDTGFRTGSVKEFATIPLRIMAIQPQCDTVGKFIIDTTLYYDGTALTKDVIPGNRLDSLLKKLNRLDSTKFSNKFYFKSSDGVEPVFLTTTSDTATGFNNFSNLPVRKDGIKLLYSTFFYTTKDGCQSASYDTSFRFDDPYAIPRNYSVTAIQPTCTVLTGSVTFDIPGFAYLRIDSSAYKKDPINNKVDTVKLYPTAPDFEPILNPIFDTISVMKDTLWFKAIPVDTAISRACPLKDTAIVFTPVKPDKLAPTIIQSSCGVDSAQIVFHPQTTFGYNQSFVVLSYNGVSVDTLIKKKYVDSTLEPPLIDSISFTKQPGKYGVITINDSAACSGDTSQITIYKMKYLPKSPVISFTTPNCTNKNKSTLTIFPSLSNVALDTIRYVIKSVDPDLADTILPKVGVDTVFEGLPPGTYNVIAKRIANSVELADPIGFEPDVPLCDTVVQVVIVPSATSQAPTMQILSADCINNLATVTVSSPIADTLRYLFVKGGTDTTGLKFDTAKTFNNIPVGDYRIYVKDTVTGCIADTLLNFKVLPEFPIVSVASPVGCDEKVGSVTFTSAQEALAYSVDKGANFSDPLSQNFSFTDLPIGQYTVTAKNVFGCFTKDSLVSILQSPSTPEKPRLTLQNLPTCTNDSVTFKVLNVLGDSLTWSINQTDFVKDDSIRLIAGTYTFTIRREGTICTNDTTLTVVAIGVTKPSITTSTGKDSYCKGDNGFTLFANASANVTKYQWYKNGTLLSIDTTLQSIVVTSVGDYKVVVSNIYGCTDSSETKTVGEFPELQVPIITSANTSVCAGNVPLTAQPSSVPVTYQWFSQDNGALNAEINASYNAANAGGYYVQISDGNCTANSNVITLTNVADKPTISGDTILCRNNLKRTTLTASDATSYQWFDADDAGFSFTTKQVQVTAGRYYVVTTVGNCAPVASDVITVLNTPNIPVITQVGSGNTCGGDITTLQSSYSSDNQWMLNNAEIKDSISPVITPSVAGDYQVKVTIGKCLPVSSDVVKIISFLDATTINGPNAFCENGSIVLTSPSTIGNTWFKDEVQIATTNQITVNEVGNYKLTVSVGNCSTTLEKTITKNNLPIVTISGDATVCFGTRTRFTPNTAGGVWTSSNESIATVDANGIATGNTTLTTGTTTINYLYTDANGCSASASKTLEVNDKLIVGEITGATKLCVNDEVGLSSNTLDGQWSTDNNLIASIDPLTGTLKAAAPGATTVTYAIDNTFCKGTATKVIPINALPIVSISGLDALCIASTTTLVGNATATSSAWSTSNDAFVTVDNTGKIVGIAKGEAIITYQVADVNGCINKAEKNVKVDVSLPVSQVQGPDEICVGAVAQVTNTTIGGVWSSNSAALSIDNAGNIAAVSESLTPATVTYKVSLDANCFGEASKAIVVNSLPIVKIDGVNVLCTGSSNVLSATPNTGGNFTWVSNNTNVVTVDGGGNVAGITAGNATITYTFTDNKGCSNKNTLDIKVDTQITVDAIQGQNNSCIGTTASLTTPTTGGTWVSLDPSIATINANSGVVTGLKKGTVTFEYLVNNGGNCAAKASKSVTIFKSAAPIIDSIKLCGSTQLSTNATGSLTWSTSETTKAISVTVPGNYSVFTTAADGCLSDTGFIAAVIRAVPTLTTEIVGADKICLNGLTTIPFTNATSGGVWESNNTAVVTVDKNTGLVTSVGAGSATVNYTITSADNCSVTKTKDIVVDNFTMQLNASSLSAIQGSTLESLTASANGSFEVTAWLPASLLPNQTADVQKNILIPTSNEETLTFGVVGKSVNTCFDTAYVTINTKTFKGDPFVPNVFTPNNDGKNDILKVYMNLANSIEFRVYNQWGEQVYVSTNLGDRGWDGTYKGKNQPGGVYMYALRVVKNDGSIVKKQGTVLLVR